MARISIYKIDIDGDIEYYIDILHKSKFKGEIFTELITKNLDDCKLFMKTPRLSQIAVAITNLELRDKFIEDLLVKVFESPESDLFTESNNYNSYWHFGSFEKVH